MLRDGKMNAASITCKDIAHKLHKIAQFNGFIGTLNINIMARFILCRDYLVIIFYLIVLRGNPSKVSTNITDVATTNICHVPDKIN